MFALRVTSMGRASSGAIIHNRCHDNAQLGALHVLASAFESKRHMLLDRVTDLCAYPVDDTETYYSANEAEACRGNARGHAGVGLRLLAPRHRTVDIPIPYRDNRPDAS